MPDISAEQIVEAELALARALLPFATGAAFVFIVLVAAGALWLCRGIRRKGEVRQ